MEYILTTELTDDERMAKLEADLVQENHKSANSQPETLMEKLYKDVKYGFAVPILIKIIKLILKYMV